MSHFGGRPEPGGGSFGGGYFGGSNNGRPDHFGGSLEHNSMHGIGTINPFLGVGNAPNPVPFNHGQPSFNHNHHHNHHHNHNHFNGGFPTPYVNNGFGGVGNAPNPIPFNGGQFSGSNFGRPEPYNNNGPFRDHSYPTGPSYPGSGRPEPW